MKTCIYFSPSVGKKHGSLLLIHGAGEHFGRYKWVVEQFNLAGYDILGGDLPGYGQSSGKKGHISRFEQYIDSVDEWYEAIQKISPFTPFVFGHSLGGLVAARFMETKRRQAQGVILSSPCFGLKVKVPLWKDWTSRALNVIFPGLVLSSEINPDHVTRNRDIVLQYVEDPFNTKGASVRWYVELVKHMEKNWQEQERFPNVPLAVHQAGSDLVTDAEQARKWVEKSRLSDKTLKVWPGLYHEILNEPERKTVIDEILKWMELRR